MITRARTTQKIGVCIMREKYYKIVHYKKGWQREKKDQKYDQR